MLQTLDQLHHNAKLCHLNLSGNNIMVLDSSRDPWDALRLLDFGLAQKCHPGNSWTPCEEAVGTQLFYVC